ICLFKQRFKPRLEFVVEVIHEHEVRLRDGAAISESRPIEFGITIWPDNGRECDVIAGDLSRHIADHAERGDHLELLSRASGYGCDGRGGNDGHQASGDSLAVPHASFSCGWFDVLPTKLSWSAAITDRP